MIGNCLYVSLIYKHRHKDAKIKMKFSTFIRVFDRNYVMIDSFKYMFRCGVMRTFTPHFYIIHNNKEIHTEIIKTIIPNLLYTFKLCVETIGYERFPLKH